MSCFVEFLAKRDPQMFLEMVSHAESVLNEAERPAKDPIWRRIARKAMPWVAGATALATGYKASGADSKIGQANKPVDDGKPQVTNVDDTVAAYNPATGKFQITPKSKAIMSQGRWELKDAGGADPLRQFEQPDAGGDPLKNFKDKPAKKVDNSAKYAKLTMDIKSGKLDPKTFKDSPDYKAARSVVDKGSSATSPVSDYDAASDLVQAVTKLAPDAGEGTATQYKYNTPQSDAQADKWVQAFKNVEKARSDTEQQIQDIKAAQQDGQERHDKFMRQWKADNDRHKALFGEKPAQPEPAKVTDGSDVSFPMPAMPKTTGSDFGKAMAQHNQEFEAIKAKYQDMGRQFKADPKSYDPKNLDWLKFRLYNPHLFGDEYDMKHDNEIKRDIEISNFKGMLRDTLRGDK